MQKYSKKQFPKPMGDEVAAQLSYTVYRKDAWRAVKVEYSFSIYIYISSSV